MNPHDSLEAVRRLYAAFGTGDMAGLFGVLDAGVEWIASGSAPWCGEGRGHACVRASSP